MRRLRHGLIMAALVLAVSACDLDVPPISAGTVTRSDGGRAVASRKLTPEQLRALSAWFGANKVGWERNFITPVPKLALAIDSTDGSSAGVYLVGTQVIVNLGGTQWAKSLSLAQLGQLFSAIGETSDG